jgi:hypothetical protein
MKIPMRIRNLAAAAIPFVMAASLASSAQAQDPLEGYASRTTVSQGDTLALHVQSTYPTYTLSVWRVGLRIEPVAGFTSTEAGQVFTSPANVWETGCGWPVTKRLVIPAGFAPGAYAVRLQYRDYFAWIPFVVRPRIPGSTSKILVQLAVDTWQAYNAYGGKSLYRSIVPGDPTRAYRVSFDRPYNFYSTNDGSGELFYWEAPFIHFLEAEGIPYEVCTNLDLHQDPHLLDPYRMFMSLGHDEYWSKEMYDEIEHYANTGGNLAFFSGNVLWWQVRFENNGHTMVCYKSAALDPLTGIDNSRVTVNWHAPPVNRPPSQLLGIYYSNSYGALPAGFKVMNPHHWVYRGVAVDSGQVFGYPMVGFEVDARPRVGSIATLQVVAHADLPDSVGAATTRPCDMAYYERTPAFGFANVNGGKIFAAGTVNYVMGLMPGYNSVSRTVGVPDPIARQVTLNVIDRMACAVTAPRLASPADNGNVSGSQTLLQWYAATPHRRGVPVRYTVHWQAAGAANDDTTSTTSLDVMIPVQTGQSYHWWVTAAAECGAVETAAARSFAATQPTDAGPGGGVPSITATRIAGTVRIHLDLAAAATTSVSVFDPAGRRVFQFAPRSLPAGPSEIVWNLGADGVRPTPSGVYFVRAYIGARTIQIKIVVLR